MEGQLVCNALSPMKPTLIEIQRSRFVLLADRQPSLVVVQVRAIDSYLGATCKTQLRMSASARACRPSWPKGCGKVQTHPDRRGVWFSNKATRTACDICRTYGCPHS